MLTDSEMSAVVHVNVIAYLYACMHGCSLGVKGKKNQESRCDCYYLRLDKSVKCRLDGPLSASLGEIFKDKTIVTAVLPR